MTDMTAFERQLSSEISGLMGPARPVEDLAVFESVTAGNRQKGWGFTMFSAVKFVAAGVIVALFGGFLVAGVFTTPQDDGMAPAAVSASPIAESEPKATQPQDPQPTPMTTEELLSGMVTEEVEPGVERIVSDGAGHDLDGAYRDRPRVIDGIAIAPDGTVWLTTTHSGDDNDDSLIWALGQPGTYTHEHGLPTLSAVPDLAILADGTLLAIGDHVLRLDDERFVRDDGPMLRQMADGGLLLLIGGADHAGRLSEGEVASVRDLRMVWETPSGAGWSGLGDHGHWNVGEHRCRLEEVPGGWDEGDEGVGCGWGWGPFTTYLVGTSIHQLAAAPDGSVWAVGEYDGGPGGLYRITPPPAE